MAQQQRLAMNQATIDLLFEMREMAVYEQCRNQGREERPGELAIVQTPKMRDDWMHWWGYENAVCKLLNQLIEQGAITRDDSIGSFERGRERGWAAADAQLAKRRLAEGTDNG